MDAGVDPTLGGRRREPPCLSFFCRVQHGYLIANILQRCFSKPPTPLYCYLFCSCFTSLKMPALIYPLPDASSLSSSPKLSSPVRQPYIQPKDNLLSGSTTVPPTHSSQTLSHFVHILPRSDSVSGATLGIIIGVSIGSLFLMGVAYVYWLRAQQWRRHRERQKKRRRSKGSSGSSTTPAAEPAAAPPPTEAAA